MILFVIPLNILKAESLSLRATSRARTYEAPSEPEGQASGRDARKERRRLRESTLRSLVNAGVCSQQSAGQLSRQLLGTLQ